MLNLPKWVQRIFDESVCPSCSAKVNKNGVFGEGVREDQHPKSKQPYLSFFFLYNCPHCKKPSTFSGMPTDLNDFIGDMIEVASSPMPTDIPITDIMGRNGLPDYSDEEGISAKEIAEFKKMLHSTKFYEDFLGKIGIDKGDIDKKDNEK